MLPLLEMDLRLQEKFCVCVCVCVCVCSTKHIYEVLYDQTNVNKALWTPDAQIFRL
jgi:hypothetical protein